eukprot:373102-Amphidinium_carterae.1
MAGQDLAELRAEMLTASSLRWSSEVACCTIEKGKPQIFTGSYWEFSEKLLNTVESPRPV